MMKDDSGKRERQITAPTKNSRDAKQDRLKLALRENLKRRKSQARGRGDRISASSNVDDLAPYDDDGGEKPRG